MADQDDGSGGSYKRNWVTEASPSLPRTFRYQFE